MHGTGTAPAVGVHGGLYVDASAPPLLVVRFEEAFPSDEDLVTLLAAIEARHVHGTPFVLVVDCGKLRSPITTAQRGLLKLASRAMSPAETRARTRVADVILTTNPLVRTALFVLQWGVETAVPKLVVRRAEEAVSFVERRCRETGLVLGDDARRWLETH